MCKWKAVHSSFIFKEENCQPWPKSSLNLAFRFAGLQLLTTLMIKRKTLTLTFSRKSVKRMEDRCDLFNSIRLVLIKDCEGRTKLIEFLVKIEWEREITHMLTTHFHSCCYFSSIHSSFIICIFHLAFVSFFQSSVAQLSLVRFSQAVRYASTTCTSYVNQLCFVGVFCCFFLFAPGNHLVWFWFIGVFFHSFFFGFLCFILFFVPDNCLVSIHWLTCFVLALFCHLSFWFIFANFKPNWLSPFVYICFIITGWRMSFAL